MLTKFKRIQNNWTKNPNILLNIEKTMPYSQNGYKYRKFCFE